MVLTVMDATWAGEGSISLSICLSHHLVYRQAIIDTTTAFAQTMHKTLARNHLVDIDLRLKH